MSAPVPAPAAASAAPPQFSDDMSLEEQFAAQEEYEAQMAATEVAASAAKATDAASPATAAAPAAAAATAAQKKKSPWRLVVETIDKTDFEKPNIALFFNLFFSVFGEYVDMVEGMNVDATVRWLECYWRDQLINTHRALKVILVDNSWPSEELARIEAQTKPRKRDPVTLEYTDEVDLELETKRIRKAIECVYTAFSAHEDKIRARDADNLFMSWWGELNDPDQQLRPGMPGFITWCTEQKWRKSWRPDLPESEQPPGTIEDVWFLLGQVDGEQDRLLDSIGTIFLLAKTLKRLSPHGWECIFAILHRLLKSVRNNEKLSMKFLKKRISKLMAAGVANIAQKEKQLVLDCLQDTFLTLSMKMERMFISFFAQIPAFVKAIFNKKLQRSHPGMSCEKFIDTTSHNLRLVRTFFQHARMHSLSRDALSAAILTKIKFTEKVDIDADTLKESAQITVQRSNDATFTATETDAEAKEEEERKRAEEEDEEEEEDGEGEAEADDDNDPIFDFSHLRIHDEGASAAAAASAAAKTK